MFQNKREHDFGVHYLITVILQTNRRRKVPHKVLHVAALFLVAILLGAVGALVLVIKLVL